MYSGSEWVKSNFQVNDMSPLGEKVADLLGDVFYGIYHLDDKALKRVQWNNTHHIEFSLGHRSLSTFDGDALTALVVLAHDRMLRMEITASTHDYLCLMFHQRHDRSGKMGYRCPTMEDHVAEIRGRYPWRYEKDACEDE